MAKELPDFELVLGLETNPDDAANIVYDAFDAAYKGERAANEDKGEFALRKIEEHIQGIVARFYMAKETINLRMHEKKVFAGIQIRKGPDNTESPAQLGENDPSMMPDAPIVVSEVSNRKTNKRRARK